MGQRNKERTRRVATWCVPGFKVRIQRSRFLSFRLLESPYIMIDVSRWSVSFFAKHFTVKSEFLKKKKSSSELGDANSILAFQWKEKMKNENSVSIALAPGALRRWYALEIKEDVTTKKKKVIWNRGQG